MGKFATDVFTIEGDYQAIDDSCQQNSFEYF